MKIATFYSFIITFFLYTLDCSYTAAEDKTRPVNSLNRKSYTLEEILSLSLEKNPSIAIFRANLEASRGEIVSARAYPNPDVEIQGGIGKSIDTGNSSGEYSIGISQQIELPKKRFYRKKAAESGAGVIERDVEDFHLQLRSEVKKAFFKLLLDKKAVEIAGENLKIVDELLKTVEIRVKAGEVPEFELVKAQVERLRADKELKKAGNRLAISRASLNALLGNALKDEFDIDGSFTLPEKRYNLETLLSVTMENHPLILKAEKELEAKGYSLERERASIFPGVTVRGFLNKEIDREAYAIGISIPIPFWYKREGEIATASAEKMKAEAEVHRIRVELSKGVTEEYQNHVIALDQIDVFKKGLLKQAEEALRISEFSYRQGESGILDFLDAQRVYTGTLMEYYRVFFELETSLAALERVTGSLP